MQLLLLFFFFFFFFFVFFLGFQHLRLLLLELACFADSPLDLPLGVSFRGPVGNFGHVAGSEMLGVAEKVGTYLRQPTHTLCLPFRNSVAVPRGGPQAQVAISHLAVLEQAQVAIGRPLRLSKGRLRAISIKIDPKLSRKPQNQAPEIWVRAREAPNRARETPNQAPANPN